MSHKESTNFCICSVFGSEGHLTAPYTSQETAGGDGGVREGEEEGRKEGRRRGRGVLDFEAEHTNTHKVNYSAVIRDAYRLTADVPILSRTKKALILTQYHLILPSMAN